MCCTKNKSYAITLEINYDDAVRPEKSIRFYEGLTIEIDLVPNNVCISRTDTNISFGIQTTTDDKTMNYIEAQVLHGKVKDKDEYGRAANYLSLNNQEYTRTLVLAQKMIDGVEMNAGEGT